MEYLGGRKFLFALLALIFSFALVLAGVMPTDQWTGFIEIIGGSYVLGNVANKFAGK